MKGISFGPIARDMQATWLDRAIMWVAPGWGLQRMEARIAMGRKTECGYNSASKDRPATRGWNPPPTSADDAALWDLTDLRARSRDAVRNQPLAQGALGRMVTNVLGASGLRPQSRVDRRALGWTPDQALTWQRQAESLFRRWSESRECDLERVLNFYGIQALALRSALESGDTFALKRFMTRPGSPFSTKLQIVEADRVDSPLDMIEGNTLAGGVEKDPITGEPVAYWISRGHPGTLTDTATALEFDRFPAFGPTSGAPMVMHVFRKDRPGQTRGVPMLAGVLEILRQLSNYGDSELMNAAISSLFTAFVTTPDRAGLPGNPSITPKPGQQSNELAMGSAAIVNLRPGESVEFADPKRPNSNFSQFTDAWCQQLGAAIDLPFEVLRLHFSSSYTAGRAALLQAVQKWRGARTWLASGLCQPSYEEVIAEGVSLGLLDAPPEFFTDPLIRAALLRAEWQGDSFGLLDPQRETAAAVQRIEAGLSNLQIEVPAMTGRDWEEVHEGRIEEVRRRNEDGVASAATTPAAVIPPDPPNQDQQNQDGTPP